MAKILLCRHGQDEDNANGILNGHRDKELTSMGKDQAKKVAEKMMYSPMLKGVDVVLTSPLLRARETAMAIAEVIGLDSAIIWDDLIERDFGILGGKALEKIPHYAKDNLLVTPKVNYFLEVDCVERFPALLNRAQRAIARLERQFKGKTVLLVAHGDIGKMLMAARRKMDWKEALRAPYIGNTDVVIL